jgi:hypothetical protein
MSDENFTELQAIAERSRERAGLSSAPRAPGAAFDKEAFLASLPVGVDTGEFERSQRTAEAMAIRGMLPPFLRSGTREAMAARVLEKDFLRVALGWRWGHGNLLLLGPTGSGKSTAVAMLFRSLLVHGVKHGGEAWENARLMAWYRADDLAEDRKEHPYGKGEAPEVSRASRARLLILDDAGWDRDPAACSTVLAARYEAGLPTIVTSGKTESELVTHYGAAVVRRMTETGGRGVAGGGMMARFPAEGS